MMSPDESGLDIQSLLLPLLMFLLLEQFDLKKRGGGEDAGDGDADKDLSGRLLSTLDGSSVGSGFRTPGGLGDAMPGGPGTGGPIINPLGGPHPPVTRMSPGVGAAFGFEPPPAARMDPFTSRFGFCRRPPEVCDLFFDRGPVQIPERSLFRRGR